MDGKLHADDKYVMTAMHDMIHLLYKYASRRMSNDESYAEIINRYDEEAYHIMLDSDYWEKKEAEEAQTQKADSC